MKTPYYLFKAYLPNGTLIRTKPVPVHDLLAIAAIYADMHVLGVRTYYVTGKDIGNKRFTLKDLSKSVRVTSIRDSLAVKV